MAGREEWRRIVGSALDWEQAHATFDSAIAGLPPELRSTRPAHYPHSVWELVDHIRAAQRDLLEFCRNADYEELKWPDDYWPSTAAPPSAEAWDSAIAAYHEDVRALADFAVHDERDLTTKIPHGSGQTYLRTILVVIDHTAYHVGQIVAVRRLLGAWPAE
jgi:uncharacterized damage-inducible protein DinB